MAAVQFKDYYSTLGIERSASQQEVKAAYRQLARKYHPDVNKDDLSAEERFKEINEAQEVLSDPAKRKMYDRYGEEWRNYQQAGFTGDEARGSRTSAQDFSSWFGSRAGEPSRTAESFSWEYSQNDMGGFSDFFQTLFGSRGGGRAQATSAHAPRKGQDIEVKTHVSLAEALSGGTRTFDIQGADICPTCNGTGIARGATCPTCDGTGQVVRTKTIEVKIPANVAPGNRIRVAGQGGPGLNGGPAGDVFLVIDVQLDPSFERQGDNLRTTVHVPLYTAVLGGETIVPTPTGRVALTIPAGSQQGQSFRLRGQGLPKRGSPGTRGDLFARLHVALPTSISDEEREHFARLRALAADVR
ncbi:MAG: DnaJ C-terminal domain-containing protein [Thermomicrobiales bacterium]